MTVVDRQFVSRDAGRVARRTPPLADGRRMIVQRLSRCLLVSVGTTLLSAAVLVALALGMGVPAGSANVVAVCCGIAPSYAANRHWVWGRSGRSDLMREVVPFWTLALAGLVASTVAVSMVASATAHWSTASRSLALPVANLAAFGALWLVQFALLDRVVFRAAPNEPAPKENVA